MTAFAEMIIRFVCKLASIQCLRRNKSMKNGNTL